MDANPAIVAITAEGGRTAVRIAAALENAEVHGLRARVPDANIHFDDTTAHLGDLFRAGRTVIGVCATGILIRAVARALDDKHAEPPVVAVSEDGAFAVPLLGGHRGGIAIASRIGEALGASVAVTTAGDRRFRVALDAPPPGWVCANPADYKAFVAGLLDGGTVRLHGDIDWLGEHALPLDDTGPLTLVATERRVAGSPASLVYHPRRLAVGVGCERGVEPDELIAHVERCLEAADLAIGAVGGVFSVDVKSDEPAVHRLAERLGVPARFFTAAELEAEASRLVNPSDIVFREVGCHGVAEGAALAAVGDAGALVLEKARSARTTCAVARAPAPLVPGSLGRARGELRVVGIGPGDAQTLTPAAAAAINTADHVVGYRLYLDLVADLLGDRSVHGYALGEERDRVRKAIDIAARGERVALVCSGDPGIYAMATLVMECLDATEDVNARRVAVTVVPGVSALQVAAARAGAPIGHDFCAISLSDLLTPREIIERRLVAAAEADFVIALYNPVSRTRRETFARALAILRAHRGADTPVVVGRNLGRPGETVAIVSLEALDPDRIDMMTVLIVGSSDTRTFACGAQLRAYTPRGYTVPPTGARAHAP